MSRPPCTLDSIVDDLRVNGPSTVREICDRLSPTGVTQFCVYSGVSRARRKGLIKQVGTVRVCKTDVAVFALSGLYFVPRYPVVPVRDRVLCVLRESEHPMTAMAVSAAVGERDSVVRPLLHRMESEGLVTSRRWFGNATYWEAVA